MAKLLHLQASPMKDRSYSRRASEAFLQSYSAGHPGDSVSTLDLATMKLPEFDHITASGKYAILHGKDHSPDEASAWKRIVAVIDDFKSADKYVVSTGMWNFGIPYRLKQYIDILVQPTHTFSFDPEKGYSGLVTGKPVKLILARGGEYPEGTDAAAYDHQRSYLELIFGFIGFTDIRTTVIEPTLMGGPDVGKKKLDDAMAGLKEEAKAF